MSPSSGGVPQTERVQIRFVFLGDFLTLERFILILYRIHPYPVQISSVYLDDFFFLGDRFWEVL